jgi:hypothetical protein
MTRFAAKKNLVFFQFRLWTRGEMILFLQRIQYPETPPGSPKAMRSGSAGGSFFFRREENSWVKSSE